MTTTLFGEWTKLTTLRYPAITMAFAGLFLAGIGAARALTTEETLAPASLLDGAGMGMLTVLALSAVATASYHGSGVHPLTLLADPRRGVVATSRILAVAAWSAVAGLLATVALTVVSLAAPEVTPTWTPTDLRAVWGQILVWTLAGALGASVGILTRRAAVSAVALVMLPMAVEPLVAMAPKVGPKVADWLPFTNLVQFYSPSSPTGSAPHLGWPGLGVFAAWVLVAAVLAVLVERRRNA